MLIAVSRFILLLSLPLVNHKLIYNVVLITVLQQSDSVIHIPVFNSFFKYTFRYGLPFFFGLCSVFIATGSFLVAMSEGYSSLQCVNFSLQ